MTDDRTITTDHVRTLLDAETGGTTLGLLEGRIEIIDADRVGDDEHRGALEIITRDELRDRLGDEPSESDLEQEADALTTAVEQLGG